MASTVNGVLLANLDSLRRSLSSADAEEAGARLAARLGACADAIEAGTLLPSTDHRRSIEIKRCYADPAFADDDDGREAVAGAGFEIVSIANDEDAAGKSDLRLAIDAMDAMVDAPERTEFVLLTAAADLTVLVERLKARGHLVAIYADDNTAAGYRAAADAVLTTTDLAAFVTGDTAGKTATATAERGMVEAFAREVHAATNIPLLSPRTFAELFRHLAEEVTTRGYHFQDTARNVAERLSAAGRNVTARQVVFVVKGLALKGHVFSTSDTAARLAEVFREQARYLIGNAGVALDEARDRLLAAWIVAPAAAPAAKPAPPPAKAATPARVEPQRPAAPARPAKPAAEKPPRKPSNSKADRPHAANGPAASPQKPPKPPERPKSAALPPKPPPEEPKPTSKSPSAADIRATIAARIAASARMKPPSRPAPPPAPKSAPPKPAAAPEGPDPIESSILAAIAEAVDVLVEDHGTAKDRDAPAPREAAAPAPAPEEARPPPEPAPPDEDSGDIGDEIQRIVASYNRNRKDDDRGEGE